MSKTENEIQKSLDPDPEINPGLHYLIQELGWDDKKEWILSKKSKRVIGLG